MIQTRPIAPRRARGLRNGAGIVLAAFLLLGCAAQRMHEEGRALIDEGRVEEGLARLQEASHEDPSNRAIRADLLRSREQAVARLANSAVSERAAERFDVAEALLKRAEGISPNDPKVKAGQDAVNADRRHLAALSEAQSLLAKGDITAAREKVVAVLVEDPSNNRAMSLRRQIEDMSARETVTGPTLHNKLRKPVTLQFRDANLKMVLEALSRTSGLNVVLDKDVRGDLKVTVFVKDTNVEDTLDLILFQNQLEKKVLGENTVLIYPNTPAKTKDYQDLKIRRFQLVNADVKQAQTALKTLLKTRDVFVDEKTNSVVMRDTAAAVRLAEKVIASIDVAEPEVMLEVEVLEITRSRALDLGLAWPTSLTLGAENPQIQTQTVNNLGITGSVVPSTTTFVQNPNFTLGALRALGLNDLIVKSAVQWQLNAAKTDGDVNTLASPRIRARNREKAKILIGSRVPVITNSVTPVASGTPVVTGSVNYLDVGLKLEVEPNVHLDGDVAIKLNLEVSNITNVVNQPASGTRAYEIGTRTAQTVLRLKDGETQILAGLIQDDQRRDSTKIPVLGDIPILGRLFGSQRDDGRKTEIVLSVTPHVVRNPQLYDVDTLEYWSGTETGLRDGTISLKGAGTSGVMGAQTGAAGAAGAPVAPAAGRPAVPARGTGLLSGFAPRTQDGAAPPQAPSVAQPFNLSIQAPSQVKQGDKISVLVSAPAGVGISNVGFSLGFDPGVFKVLAVSEGDLVRKASAPSNFSQDVDQGGGQVVIGLSENGGSAVSGGGSVAVIQLEVVAAKGGSQLSLSRVSATGANDAPLTANAPPPVIINTVAQ
ncbi:MAG: secretin and TonB N-terminal domain-containing protein [Sterolibacteriaceae bacterium]|nr:secretin and TonB N-terminal domain-containing protein [Sterolibacteriaceae bacterium]MBK9087311.1 secretin and TonB N-terminal domain-containing protein [Sterolibacteriaceae bacterium]